MGVYIRKGAFMRKKLLLTLDDTFSKDLEAIASSLGMNKAEVLRYGFRILKTWQQCKKEGFNQLVFKNPDDEGKEKILVDDSRE
jgi:hypothetical protein